MPTSRILTQLEAKSVDQQRVELWVPRCEDVEADDCSGEEKGVALYNHQHPSTSSLKKTEINKKIFPARGVTGVKVFAFVTLIM